MAPRGRPIDGSGYRSDLEYRKADLHLHSSVSHDVPDLPGLSPRALYDRAVVRGMGLFTLTDHGMMDGILALREELAHEFGASPPIPIVTGVELKIHDPAVGHTVHVNVLGLDTAQLAELKRRRRSLSRFLRFCRREGLFHVYNHPFWFQRGEHGSVRTIELVMGEFPLVELNAGRIQELNARTGELARRHGKELIATSDSHTGQVGKSYTMAPGETPEAFLDNVARGISRALPAHMVFGDFIREIKETIALFFGAHPPMSLSEVLPDERPGAPGFVYGLLEHPWLLRFAPVRRALQATLGLVARAPAYLFIREQRRMHLELPGGDS